MLIGKCWHNVRKDGEGGKHLPAKHAKQQAAIANI